MIALMNHLRPLLLLAGLAVAGSVLIALLAQNTQELRQYHIDESARAPLKALLADIPFNNDVVQDWQAVEDKTQLQLEKPAPLYIARNDQMITAVIVPVRFEQAYVSSINSQVAVDKNLTILAVAITEHQESLSLVTAYNDFDPAFLAQFNGIKLQDLAGEKWTVKKDGGHFDQITGATVSSRAVVQSVYRALRYVEKENLLEIKDKALLKENAQHGAP